MLKIQIQQENCISVLTNALINGILNAFPSVANYLKMHLLQIIYNIYKNNNN